MFLCLYCVSLILSFFIYFSLSFLCRGRPDIILGHLWNFVDGLSFFLSFFFGIRELQNAELRGLWESYVIVELGKLLRSDANSR